MSECQITSSDVRILRETADVLRVVTNTLRHAVNEITEPRPTIAPLLIRPKIAAALLGVSHRTFFTMMTSNPGVAACVAQLPETRGRFIDVDALRAFVASLPKGGGR